MICTSGTTRMVVAGIVLMGGALSTFGDIRTAAVDRVFPRVRRTEQEQTARLRTDSDAPALAQGFSLVARERSGESDPCVPVAPVTFSVRGPEIC